MSAAELREKLDALRLRLRETEQQKADATELKAFESAMKAGEKLEVDIEFTAQQLARAEQAEAAAERGYRELQLTSLLPHVTPDAVGADLAPLIQDVVTAHRAHLDAVHALGVQIANKRAKHTQAVTLATELGKPAPVDPKPLERATVEVARGLVGERPIGPEWQRCPADEAALLALAHSVYAVRTWSPDANLEDAYDYPAAEQLARILDGSHEEHLRALLAQVKALRTELAARGAEQQHERDRRIQELVKNHSWGPGDAVAHVDAQIQEQANAQHAQIRDLIKSGVSRKRALLQVNGLEQ